MNKHATKVGAVVVCAALLVPELCYAQTDAGSLLRDIKKEQDKIVLPQSVPPVSGAQAPIAQGSQVTVKVAAFTLKGIKLLQEAEIQSVLSPWIGNAVAFSGLQQAADAVTSYYRSKGYLVRTYLPEQDIGSGVITLVVLEGKLGSIDVQRIDSSANLSNERVRNYISAHNDVGQPIRADDLQRSITLLNALPGSSVSSILEPGAREGESRVIVQVADTPKYTGYAQFDNSGSYSTGEYRTTLGFNVNSPLGIGDQISMAANASEHANYYRAAYQVPVAYDGLRIGGSISRLPYSYSLLSTTYAGTADVKGISINYPFVRSNEKNLTVGVAVDRKQYFNTVQGVELNNKQVDVNALSVSGDELDALFGGGLTQFSFTVSGGQLDLSRSAADVASDQVANGADRQGNFNKLSWNIARLQRLTSVDTLALTFSGQKASKNLDSSEKFLATGPDAVRAFSSSEASGDEGMMLNLEWRRKVTDALTASVFYDTATLTRDRIENIGTLSPQSGTFSGVGVGLAYTAASSVVVRGSVAWRSGSNPFSNPANGNDADGSPKNPRVWLSLTKTF